MDLEGPKREKERIEKLIQEEEKAKIEEPRIEAKISVKVNRYPKFCAECPMFYLSEYRCHNEHGIEANCKLGYMDGEDTRGWSGKYRFNGCKAIIDGKMILEEY